MSILNILEFPDERLKTIAKQVETVDDDIRELVGNMLETMYEAKGVGLAATQVDVHKQIIVIDVCEDKKDPICLINPEIIEQHGTEESEEGCLSVPGFFENVQRAEKVTVRALDTHGKSFVIEAEDFLAVCIQHEMDHLQGKLFVDYLSPLKRQRIKKKLDKIHRLERSNAKAALASK